ncbi:DNA/RNA non-specific endonuclease [Chitinophaga sp. 22321]|uniref:DNA/RNA non-specific endonuclease n=1 Tax=Chitinophaga hostae TaxID=2831022 RepID=A0ABS5J153_9BACT|nr:DNA/RNA non-specific endonuclease [Chitinophaga hostae]MBS0028167.1 DNA/RNA non-specific endonuclease [Chitinophaga hostae]
MKVSIFKTRLKSQVWLCIAFFSIIISGCSKKELLTPLPDEHSKPSKIKGANVEAVTFLLQENFEWGNKGSYADADVQLASGSWNLSDALIGSLVSDRREGQKSIRVRNGGMVHMNFDLQLSSDANVTVKHGVFGNDESSTWELWASTDQGSTYFKIGNTVASSTASLQTASFKVTNRGAIRFELRKTDGGINRINFDDFTIATEGTPGGGSDPVPGDNDHLLLGNPTDATSSLVMINNYLMNKVYYQLSYSRDRGEPNWVCWHLSSEDLGSASRSNDFRSDPSLSDDWYRVLHTSYSRSGFDRGHNCPSGDRTSSEEANSATFLMTNMIPQAPTHNRGMWERLESYTRQLVRDGNEVYVIMGSYGAGGVGSNGEATTIDNGNVTVPGNIWKVIVVLPDGNNDLARINNDTRVIAVNTPNSNDVNADWSSYLTSVRNIESVANCKLLTNVPENIRSVLRSKVDAGQ